MYQHAANAWSAPRLGPGIRERVRYAGRTLAAHLRAMGGSTPLPSHLLVYEVPSPEFETCRHCRRVFNSGGFRLRNMRTGEAVDLMYTRVHMMAEHVDQVEPWQVRVEAIESVLAKPKA